MPAMLTEAKWMGRLMAVCMVAMVGECGLIAWRTNEIALHQRNLDARLETVESKVLSSSVPWTSPD
jgi:hypothetical protein